GRCHGRRRRSHADEVGDATAQHRVGENGGAVELDQHGRVPEPGDPAVAQKPLRRLLLVSPAAMAGTPPFGEPVAWKPAKPRFKPVPVVISWLLSAAALFVAAWIVPGVSVEGFLGAVVAALLIGILNAVLPPVIAALRLPFTAALGFLLVLAADAGMLYVVSEVAPGAIKVSSFWWALV